MDRLATLEACPPGEARLAVSLAVLVGGPGDDDDERPIGDPDHDDGDGGGDPGEDEEDDGEEPLRV